MRKDHTHSTLSVASVFLSLMLLPSCVSRETAPFEDGDYFEYTMLNKDYGKQYEIEKTGQKTFTITWHTGVSEPDELIVDLTGKIVETPDYPEGSLAHDLFYGRQITLWLPTDKRTVGEQIHFADFIDRNVVIEERYWEQWNVWVTKHSNIFGWQENYFDKETGFLVGSNAAGEDIYILSASSRELIQ